MNDRLPSDDRRPPDLGWLSVTLRRCRRHMWGYLHAYSDRATYEPHVSGGGCPPAPLGSES